MSNEYKSYFESVLDIYQPWSIANISIDERQSEIHIQLSYSADNSIISFITKKRYLSPETKLVKGCWQHSNLGNLRCFVSAEVPEPNGSESISQQLLVQPDFLGCPTKRYSHKLRQLVALANKQGLTKNDISIVHNIDLGLVDSILTDLANAPESLHNACFLPTETAAVWQDILFDKTLIKTQSFPLKLLLSKLKLAAINTQNKAQMRPMILEIREFIVHHGASLHSEISQLAGIPYQHASADSRRREVHKLILPAIKNPVWSDILTNKIQLNSDNMSLNLLLVKLKSNYQKHNIQDSQHAEELSRLRDFFRKNYKTLKNELVQINQLLKNKPKPKYTLPDSGHGIWKQILMDDSFIPSQHMAYKLLLSKLRSDMLINPGPHSELNAARRIRKFIAENQKSMQQELKQVILSSRAV